MTQPTESANSNERLEKEAREWLESSNEQVCGAIISGKVCGLAQTAAIHCFPNLYHKFEPAEPSTPPSAPADERKLSTDPQSFTAGNQTT